MKQDVKIYLSEIGRRGGRKSRRKLDSETTRAMVRVREVRRAYRRFHADASGRSIPPTWSGRRTSLGSRNNFASTAGATHGRSRQSCAANRLPGELGSFALQKPDVRFVPRAWLEALDSVNPFVAARPPEEIGCLYYSAAQQKFVDPREAHDATPHYGRPGGVLPRVTNS